MNDILEKNKIEKVIFKDNNYFLICERILTNPVDTCNTKKVEVDYYPLTHISEEELLQKRASKIPGFVYKVNNNLFYTSLPNNLSFPYYDKHICSSSKSSHVCKRLMSLEDSEGGCVKVKDRSFEYYNQNIRSIRCLKHSKRIEKYDFITEGFETFNTTGYNIFIVLSCKNHENSSK